MQKIEHRIVDGENLRERKGEHDHNHDVDQIVANEDGGEQLFGIGEQLLHPFALGVGNGVDVVLREREKGNLSTREKCREEKSRDSDNDGNDRAQRWIVNHNGLCRLGNGAQQIQKRR